MAQTFGQAYIQKLLLVLWMAVMAIERSMLTEMRPSPLPVNAKPVMMKSLGFAPYILAKESVSKTSTAPSFESME